VGKNDSIAELVATEVFHDVSSGNHFRRRTHRMEKDVEEAVQRTQHYKTQLVRSMEDVVEMENTMGDTIKRVSGKVRDSAQKLSDGLAKIEKVANFDRLERYVELLERADKAMSSLAELEKSGKLEKIASAIR